MSSTTTSAKTAARSAATSRKGLRIERRHVPAGVDPYSLVEWGTRDVVLTNWRDGSINFEQRGVEFPVAWSEMQGNICTSKYFRGKKGTPARESSLKQVVDRIVDTYHREGLAAGYFASEEDAQAFADELKFGLVTNLFAFNSPVWFNVGTDAPQQVSACYILALADDSLQSILNWYTEEGMIFKGGSGAGINLSKLRSSKEILSSGGSPSGPVSFMRGADASAGTIQSGGATRRAAKMVVLDVDHPDIREFIRTKADEERKVRALRDAGFDMDLGGKDITSVQYQNANNSVRVTDEFMRAVELDETFDLLARKDGSVMETVQARQLFRELAQAAWECADPGLQYVGSIDRMHTLPNYGPISATNPCAEYVHIDDSSCNLASLNLMKFYDSESGRFDADAFRYMARLVFIAAEISICFGSFPTEKIGVNTRKARPIGLGYANLGAMLMTMGHGYDTEIGRQWAGAVTALMTGEAYATSAELAGVVGPFEYFADNREAMLGVIDNHRQSAIGLANTVRVSTAGNLAEVAGAAEARWSDAYVGGETAGFRNSQATVLAPTGTIGLVMGCDTTGIEPDLALVKYKSLADGTSMKIVNGSVPAALRNLGYAEADVKAIADFVVEHDTIVGSGLREEHLPVFETAMGDGQNAHMEIAPMGHVRMMAAAQPFISGAISKTINMPETATVEDIEQVYLESWKLGIKCQAVYRNNCKAFQPLNVTAKAADSSEAAQAEATAEVVERIVEKIVEVPRRERLPMRRSSETISFEINGPDGSAEGYLQPGSYPDGRMGEMFLKMSKQGSTLGGLTDALATVVSIALQYGVPLEVIASKFIGTKFAPAGMTNDPDVRLVSSPLDYVGRRLALDFLDGDTRAALGVFSNAERTVQVNGGSYGSAPAAPAAPAAAPKASDQATDAHRKAALSTAREMPMCLPCGIPTIPAGACGVCPQCGSTTGCS
ncbi:MAG: vitamin B12-dependent ribonucleotide reductase [Nocardioidaceae bacterium]